ncbi:MAG: hypothetical protein JWO67_72 [Streptosporangiaceae bacterium]|nr:hypothetical protein [Streptosporangiaceae bacterium]
MSLNPEIYQVAAAAFTFGGAAICAVAYDRLTAGRGVRRAPRPRGERVPATVGPEPVVPYAGFHDGPLALTAGDEYVAIERSAWCAECTGYRALKVYADGSMKCRVGHVTPAGEAL